MRYIAFIFLLGCIIGVSICTTNKQNLSDKEVVEVYRFNVTYVDGVPLINNPERTYGSSTKGLALYSSQNKYALQQLYLGNSQTTVIDGNIYWVVPIKDLEFKHISGFMLVRFTDYKQQEKLNDLSMKLGYLFKQDFLFKQDQL